MKRVMVFAPHMDDEVIGCGGSILKHHNNNDKIHIVYFTDGSYLLSRDQLKNDYVNERLLEVKKVCSTIDATYTTLNIPDRTLEYNEQILNSVINEIIDYQPNIIYIPHIDEQDREHRIVNEIVKEAMWLSNAIHDIENSVNCTRSSIVLEYEVWTPIQKVDFVNDITPYIEKKDQLIKLYDSQIVNIMYNEAAIALNRYRGIMNLHKDAYGEGFVINKISKSPIMDLLGFGDE